jgi:hypothetical protein
MSPFIIEFEAFQHRGHYKLKELCIMDMENPLSPLYFIFASRRS